MPHHAASGTPRWGARSTPAGGRPVIRERTRTARVPARVAVLAGLAMLTIAAPLAELLPASAYLPPDAAVQTAPSLLAALEATAPAAGTEGTPASLRADPVARVRALAVSVARSDERQPLAQVAHAASGIRAASTNLSGRVVMPMAAGSFRISSGYGWRNDPFGRGRQFHEGQDMAGPRNTPIYAVADGVVEYVGPAKAGRSGEMIILRHEIDGKTVYSWYNHMYRDGLYVRIGQEVSAGDVIAGVGNNGYSTGPHLHFEIHTDDRLTTTDPQAWLAEQGAVDVTELDR
ncbi:MAG: M23 family metallopeptidase [Georgenia sp.]